MSPEPSVGRASQPRGPARSVLIIVFSAILIDFIGFTVLIPVLPLYAERLGASPPQVGLILTLYAMAQLLFLPAWGWVSDRIGRRPVLLISLSGTVLSFLVLAQADTIPMIYLARALAGFFAASIGTAQAVVTDVTPPEDRAGGMGMIGAAFGAGMIVGPVMGGVLAEVHEKAPFYAISLLAAANLVLAWVRLPETREPEEHPPPLRDLAVCLIPTPLRLMAAGHDRRVRLYLYFFFHLFTAFAVLESMVTLYLALQFGAGELRVALIFAWIGLVLAITQGFLLRRLVVWLGEERLVGIGFFAMAAGLAGVAAAPSLGWFYPVGALIAFGNGVAFPTFTGLFSRACPTDQMGELLAQSQSMATAGRIVGPVAAGYAMAEWTIETPFLVASAMMLLALLSFRFARSILIDQSAISGTAARVG